MSQFMMDTKDYDRIEQKVMSFSDGSKAEKIINSCLSGEGAEILKEGIHTLLPVSGRQWSGKSAAAKSAHPFSKVNGNLSVRIVARGRYGYLYFPDDGSNTVRHAGGQNFMYLGAESKAKKVADTIVDKLIEGLEGK